MFRLLVSLFALFVPVSSVICPADISGGPNGAKDGQVNVEDLISVLKDYGSQSKQSDINQNGIVDVEDVLSVLKSYGRKGCDKPNTIPVVAPIDFCKTNKQQMCRQKCPSRSSLQSRLNCKQDQCYERIGTCCNFGCKKIPSCGKYPCDCVKWFDGCNRCSIDQGKIKMCTSMACFVNTQSYCIKYINGTTCISRTKCSGNTIQPPPPPPPPPGPGEVVIGRPYLQNKNTIVSESVEGDCDWIKK